jgi:hypothetical protein
MGEHRYLARTHPFTVGSFGSGSVASGGRDVGERDAIDDLRRVAERLQRIDTRVGATSSPTCRTSSRPTRRLAARLTAVCARSRPLLAKLRFDLEGDHGRA